MSVIGKLLCLVRHEQDLTQEQLVTQLVSASREFKALNPVTLSRWETGKTSTSFHKKRELLKIFTTNGWLRNGQCHDFVRKRFECLDVPLKTIFKHNYQSIIANVPTLRVGLNEYNLHSLQGQKGKHTQYHFENIIDLEVASNPPDYYTVTPESLQSLCSHESSYSIVCERKNQHLGHFIMFKLKNSTARQIANNRIHEHSLTNEQLCDRSRNGSCYIHALYGANATITALINTKAYLHLFDNMDTIDNIVIFSSRKDGMRIAKAYGIKIILHGWNNRYNFNWYGMESPVEDILFSDTILRLVF